jgi:hypothetical protein
MTIRVGWNGGKTVHLYSGGVHFESELDISYPDEDFHGFRDSLQAVAGIIATAPPPSKYFRYITYLNVRRHTAFRY